MIVHTLLRPFFTELKHEFPNILVELTVNLSARLKDELFSRSIDLAFQETSYCGRCLVCASNIDTA
jgi:hypothetical protein